MTGLKADPDPNAFSSGPPADDPHAFTSNDNEPAAAQADDEGDLK
jgi:hypothetical protein